MTYWGSCAQALQLGVVVIFADIDPTTLCIEPSDIEHRITDRTKAIIAVHYAGHPCDMEPIMAIAEANGVDILEDVSHAQGTLYKGRKVRVARACPRSFRALAPRFNLPESVSETSRRRAIWAA
jgi:dTDP-4-amino-4,6-dideoxygalactose transaminase